MKNYRQRGDAIYATVGGSVKAGEYVAIVPAASSAGLFGPTLGGVSGYDCASSGVVGVFHRSGIFSLPKLSASSIANFAPIFYDTVLKVCTATNAASCAYIGHAVPQPPYTGTVAAAVADLVVDVLLQ